MVANSTMPTRSASFSVVNGPLSLSSLMNSVTKHFTSSTAMHTSNFFGHGVGDVDGGVVGLGTGEHVGQSSSDASNYLQGRLTSRAQSSLQAEGP